MPLTDAKVRTLRYRAGGQKKHADGGGLFILLTPTAKLWRYKHRSPDGRERLVALGAYPDVSLARARVLHAEARAAVAAGQDPTALRREARAKAPSASTTFQAIAEEWLEKFGASKVAKTRSNNRERLERFAFPRFGRVQVADVTASMVLEALHAVEARGTLDTAHRLRQVVSQVLRYAVGNGHAERDVTADLRGALPAPPVRHMAAITDPAKVGPLLRAIDGYDGIVVRAALKLAALVFVRPGELRAAEWTEVDVERAEWNIPAAKMKMKVAHVVPLARQAIAIIEELRPYTGGGRYLFPNIRTAERPMSDATLTAALRRIGIPADEMVPHGFRAMARTILDEVLGEPVNLIEHQLAHQVRDPLGNAYNRATHLRERRALMQRWADYLDGLKTENVIAFPRAGAVSDR